MLHLRGLHCNLFISFGGIKRLINDRSKLNPSLADLTKLSLRLKLGLATLYLLTGLEFSSSKSIIIITSYGPAESVICFSLPYPRNCSPMHFI